MISEAFLSSADILDRLLLVDGAGSDLDAALLEGQEGAYYLDPNNLSGPVGPQEGGTGLNTIAANRMLYSSALNTFTPMALTANGVLVTDNLSVPSMSAILPPITVKGTGVDNFRTQRGTLPKIFYATWGDTSASGLELSVNRSPESGDFDDALKGHAKITILSGIGYSEIYFGTAAAANTLATNNIMIDRNGRFVLTNVPTADPHVAGMLWNSSGTIHISAG